MQVAPTGEHRKRAAPHSCTARRRLPPRALGGAHGIVRRRRRAARRRWAEGAAGAPELGATVIRGEAVIHRAVKILLAAAEAQPMERSEETVACPTTLAALSDDARPLVTHERLGSRTALPGRRRAERSATRAPPPSASRPRRARSAAGGSLEAAQDALVLAAQHAAASRDSRDPMARARAEARAPPRRRAGPHRRRLALRWRRAVGSVGASSVGGGAAAVGRMGAAARRVPASAPAGYPPPPRRPPLPLPGLPAATKLRVPARRRGGHRPARRPRLAAHAVAVCRRHRRRTGGGGTGGGRRGVGPAEPGGGGGGAASVG